MLFDFDANCHLFGIQALVVGMCFNLILIDYQ